jgi:superfamily II DNA or RNA helicase
MNQGIYEELVTQIVAQRIGELENNAYYINKVKIDKEEAVSLLAQHLSRTIKSALNFISGTNQIEKQIEIANKIIVLLKEELNKEIFEEDLIQLEGEILKGVFSRANAYFSDVNLHLKEITPYTRLTHSELFTGGNVGLSLESELKKEILSSNRIDLLVSFIKFKGIIILEKALREFTDRGGILRVITTTYMGASDYKAIQLLSQLKNTEIKISYNNRNERLHAKAYLFFRNTGFHTGYIGSSNFSRSALTDGLEWNIKITTKEISHIIEKFQKTFNSYWQSSDFEIFKENLHKEKLQISLSQSSSAHFTNLNNSFFDVNPYPFQLEILEKLEVERNCHHRFRNLIVAATGTGKTVISAFDYKKFRQHNQSSKILFLAHRKEILNQSLNTFRGILKDNNFGELWLDGFVPSNYEYVFASVNTLNNRLENIELSPEYYDYIVVDECHHLKAASYRDIISYFKPKILLGLTATPERMDGGDIQEDFHNRIAAEIRLPEALNRKLLCPFQYFGISDSVDLSSVTWEKGKYAVSELTYIYTANNKRVGEIILAIDKYTKDIKDVRALGFCVSIEHARFMAEKFLLAGLKADYLTSANVQDRDIIRRKLQIKEINYLFVVDIFNEGVDIPEIDTVLFLRPTESLTVFLQQLGRGLRLAENKECLTVLDFVGNSRPEYNFENKFRALIGKTATAVKKEIEDNFPHLPLGCSIVLEKKAKETILTNVSSSILNSQGRLVQKIRSFKHESTLPLNLKNFVQLYNIPLYSIYKLGGFRKLCHLAGIIESLDPVNESVIVTAIQKKWLASSSSCYFEFLLRLAKNNFDVSGLKLSNAEKQMLLMLYYDVWYDANKFSTLEQAILEIGRNKYWVEEIVELLTHLLDTIDYKELPIALPYAQPLMVHSRYTRDQVLAAFGKSLYHYKYPSREGVVEIKEINTVILFINLIKSAEDFSPTTMYDDYAISENLFHWQSQNSTGPDTPRGKSYINHQKSGKRILLFVREKATDEYRRKMGYVFLGEGILKEYYGTKPMSIVWELLEPMPHFLWKDAAKLLVG